MCDYSNWILGVTPDTNPNAEVIDSRSVTGASVIEVVGGKYREARLNGVFELVDGIPRYHAGKKKMEVRCAWFGVRPRTRYPYLDISEAEVVRRDDNYSGEVANNIGIEEVNNDHS